MVDGSRVVKPVRSPDQRLWMSGSAWRLPTVVSDVNLWEVR